MRRPALAILVLLVVSALALTVRRASDAGATSLATVVAPSSHGLRTAFIEPEDGTQNNPLTLRRMRRAGATGIRTYLSWYTTAPAQRPANFDPADPNDPAYKWSAFDTKVKRLVAAGLEPLVVVRDGPDWARIKSVFTNSPVKADDFRDFMHAAALRYSGHTPGLPRVRYWQVWIEPNLSPFFTPQFDFRTKQFTSPDVYRAMVNAAYDGIHSAVPSDVVVAGGLAPFRDITPQVLQLDKDWGPLKFMRRMLCVSDRGLPTCSDSSKFDAWAMDPYTSGGPQHHAVLKYDVSLGDLAEVRSTLNAAIRAGHVTSDGDVRFVVSEFSWDSRPPDPCAPPARLLERWVPEALYRMWAVGVDTVMWLQLEDQPLTTSYYQSGLWYYNRRVAAAEPKPYLEGFRFPFVALRRGHGVYVWGRVPPGARGSVRVEQDVRGAWRPVATLRPDGNGIVQRVLKAHPTGAFRAGLVGGETSLSFSMTVPPDHFYNPFGQPTLLEPTKKPQCVQKAGSGTHS